MPLDDHDLAAVLEYVSAEHGGQQYRASVISHEGAILYASKLTIAGPPRRRGRVTSRDAWEGLPEHTERHQEPQQAAPQMDLIALMRVLNEQQAAERSEQAEANRQRDQQIDRLVTSLMADRRMANAPPAPPPSLRDQLREVVEATQAVDEIRDALTVDAPARGRQEAPRSPLAGVIEQAAGAMLAQGLQNDQQRRQTAPRQRPPQGPPQGQQRPRRQVQEHRAPQPQRTPPTRPQEPNQ
jgi:hypothetical protein